MKFQQQLSMFLKASLAFASLGFLFLCTPIYAQEEEGRRFENAETSRVRALSEQTARRLTPVRELLSPNAEEGQEPPPADPAGAVRALERVRTADLPSHEKAEIWNLYAFAYYLLEDEAKALEYYERVVNEPEANAPLRNRTLKTVAQLCIISEDWSCALERMQQWMALQQILGADDFALLSTIYYYQEDLGRSLENMEKAIDMRESLGEIGKENWYSIQRSIYYQRNDFRKVISILEKLIVNYPHVRYWRELGGMYAELEDEENQMNAFVLAYLQKGLTTESQLVGLSYMYIAAEAPYKGAQILDRAIEAGHVNRSEKNMQLAGSAYYQARELEKALPFMEAAAESATSGESFGRLAGIYLDLDRNDDAIRTGREALSRRGLRQRHLVELAVGTALFNKKDYDGALQAFRAIGEDSRGWNPAQQWIKHVNSVKRRDQQIRDSGIDLDKVLSSSR